MDFMKIALTCLIGIAMLHATEAGCVEDILNDNAFKICLEEYSTYAANAKQAGAGGEDAAAKMVATMCSIEGQAAMSCVHPFIERCEDLKNAEGMSDFAGLAKMGGVAEACKTFAGPCMAIVECVSKAKLEVVDGPYTPDLDTPFGTYQMKIKLLCGPVKHQIDCISGKEKECPQIKEQIKSMLQASREQATPGTAFGNYTDIVMFVKKECPNIPADFSTNKCVYDNLKADEFKDCFVNSTKPFTSNSGEIDCDAYKASYTCIPKAIDSCGKKYVHAFTAITNMYLKVTHKDCKLPIEDTSDSNVVRMSSAIIFSSFLLAYIMI